MSLIYNLHGNILRNGDMMSFELSELTDSKVNFIYSDPPWGEGNLKYWQTMNKKMNGVEPKQVDFPAFLEKFFQICNDALTDDGVVFMEYGPRWKSDVECTAKVYGFTVRRYYTPQYRAGKGMLPLDLFVFTRTSNTKEYSWPDESVVNNTYGYATLQKVFSTMTTEPNMILLDPCCGMGYSAKLAISRGMKFIGNELNYKRIQKTKDRFKNV